MGKPTNCPPVQNQMGKPNNGRPSIHHFSHPHPLELHVSNAQQAAMNGMVSCSGCKLNASGTFYTCKPCNYILHISCSQMAQHITHPVDPNHTLSLLPIPAYPEGHFGCDACGISGNGFSYHCQTCNIDIHSLCAVMPLSIHHQSHHHQLTLTFSPPYQNKSFTCDVCHQEGSNHWLYRCNSCGFDAHLGCARTKPKTPPQTQTQTQPIYQQTAQRRPQTQTQPIYQQTTVQGSAILPQNQNRSQGNGFVSNLFQNVISGAAQQLGKTVVQGIIGGQGGSCLQTQTQPIYQQTVQAQTQTRPIYQQTVQRTAIPQATPQQTQTQTQPIYQQTVQRTAFPPSTPLQQTQPIYQQTIQRPAIPQYNYGHQFGGEVTWKEGARDFGNPDEAVYGDAGPDQIHEQVTWSEDTTGFGNPNGPDQIHEQVTWSEDTTDFGNPNGPDQIHEQVTWSEEATDLGNPNEVVYGAAEPHHLSEQETIDYSCSWNEENPDFRGDDGGGGDFPSNVADTDGGYADGSESAY